MEAETSDTTSGFSKAEQVPPIVINTVNTDIIQQLIQLINEKSPDTKIKYTKTNITIKPLTKAAHKDISSELQKLKIEFHTYTPKCEKDLILVMRGLPNINIEWIKGSIITQEIKAKKVQKLQPEKITEEPLYLVNFENNVDKKNIFNIRYVCNIRVYWESLRNPRKITQCYNCQKFGHVATNCSNTPRCVKCPENHDSRTCTKDESAPPHCVNCGKAHPANYRKCCKYIEHLEKVQQTREKRAQTQRSKNLKFQPKKDDFPRLRAPPRTLQGQHEVYLPNRTAAWNNNNQGPTTPWNNINQGPTPSRTPFNQTNANPITPGVSDIYNLTELMKELREMNQLCNISKILETVRILNQKLKTIPKDDIITQTQVFLEVFNNGSD